MDNFNEIEVYIKDPEKLIRLNTDVINHLCNEVYNKEKIEMDAQLREIARAIDKLYKQGITIPEGLRSEKIRLATALNDRNDTKTTLSYLVDELEILVESLNVKMGRIKHTLLKKKRFISGRNFPTGGTSILKRSMIYYEIY
jgi:hypothetical protein